MARVLVVFLVAAIAASAQVSERPDERESARDRLRRAGAEIERIAAVVEAAPDAREATLSRLPDPPVALVDAADALSLWLEEFADLPSAGRALDLLAETLGKAGDATGRALVLLRSAERQEESAKKAPILVAAAREFARLGDAAGALKLAKVVADDLGQGAAAPSEDELRVWSRLEDEDRRRIARIRSLFEARDPRVRADGAREVGSFLLGRPRHGAAPELVASSLAALGDEQPGLRRELADRIAFHFPDHEEVRALIPALLPAMAAEGDYERALHLLRREARRRGDETPSELESTLRARLARIAARAIDLPRKTRRLRRDDILRRLARGETEWALDLLEGFRADYPTSSVTPALGWEVARAALDSLPEEGLGLLRRLLDDPRPLPFRGEAAATAWPRIREIEGVEAAAEFLDGQAKRVEDLRTRGALGLDRAALLVEAERYEDAAAALGELVASPDAAVSAAARRRLDEVEKLLGG